MSAKETGNRKSSGHGKASKGPKGGKKADGKKNTITMGATYSPPEEERFEHARPKEEREVLRAERPAAPAQAADVYDSYFANILFFLFDADMLARGSMLRKLMDDEGLVSLTTLAMLFGCPTEMLASAARLVPHLRVDGSGTRVGLKEDGARFVVAPERRIVVTAQNQFIIKNRLNKCIAQGQFNFVRTKRAEAGCK